MWAEVREEETQSNPTSLKLLISIEMSFNWKLLALIIHIFFAHS